MRSRRARIGRVALWVFCIIVLVYLMLPILIVVPISFSSAKYMTFPPPGVSLQWYRHFFATESWLGSTGRSLLVALATVVASSVLGTMCALGLSRIRPGIGRLINGLVMSPMVIPVIITAVAVYSLYTRFAMTGNLVGLILAHTVLALPFVVVNVAAVLQGFDHRLEQAARNLGASPGRAFFNVTLPLIKPGIIAGAIFAFVTSFDEVVVAIFVTGPGTMTLPAQVWSSLRTGVDPTIAAVSTLLICVTSVVLITTVMSERSGRK